MNFNLDLPQHILRY